MNKLFILLFFIVFFSFPNVSHAQSNSARWWQIQSIDTMKLSRDEARARLFDPGFDQIINSEISKISDIGATHVAIGTPYDEEFLPYLKRWVDAARNKGLNVWFRGNFSGWEGWFDYQQISKEVHIEKLRDFISDNPMLFADGDIFTPCPECENGVLGDPRQTGNVDEFRRFLISEYEICRTEMQRFDKNVRCGFFSMNGDVAELVMDSNTATSTGGVIAIDHYTKTSKELVTYIKKFKEKTKAQIILGEMGVPIPDIHGNLNETSQARWLEQTLSELSQKDLVMGLNYWVLTGGSTALWNQDGSKRIAASVLETYFSPEVIECVVLNSKNKLQENVIIYYKDYVHTTNKLGKVRLLKDPLVTNLKVQKDPYKELNSTIEQCDSLKLVSDGSWKNNLIIFLRDFFNL